MASAQIGATFLHNELSIKWKETQTLKTFWSHFFTNWNAQTAERNYDTEKLVQESHKSSRALGFDNGMPKSQIVPFKWSPPCVVSAFERSNKTENCSSKRPRKKKWSPLHFVLWAGWPEEFMKKIGQNVAQHSLHQNYHICNF
jgi:hypothetical protein